jgi:hypothetical protein
MELPTGKVKRIQVMHSRPVVNIGSALRSDGLSQLAHSSSQRSLFFYKSADGSCSAQIVKRWPSHPPVSQRPPSDVHRHCR